MMTESLRTQAVTTAGVEFAVLPPAAAAEFSRRGFLKSAGTAALVLGFFVSGRKAMAGGALRPSPPTASFQPNAFLSVDSTGAVTIVVNHAEMGQGVATALPMLVAEELDADWSKVRTEFAPVDAVFNHAFMGMQMTGGSTSVHSEYERLRAAGATARAMLVSAAALEWKVPAAECRTEPGMVLHRASERRRPYGALVARAAMLPVPTQPVRLKAREEFRLLGKPTRRLDSRSKVTGAAQFGLDVRRAGMLTAVVARAPVFGGTLEGFDEAPARGVPGVEAVVAVPSGVAVIARDFWAAERGREALRPAIRWRIPPESEVDSDAQAAAYARLARTPGAAAENTGDVDAALQAAATVLEADYTMPYLAHAPMEPLNAVVEFRGNEAEVWTGTQFQTIDRANVAAVLGLEPEKVKLHTTYLGGGFGRRATAGSDWVVEAAHVARNARSAGVIAPVKVVWTREDDLAGGYYRPMFHHRLVGGLDASGKVVAWRQTLVGQSFMVGTPFESFAVKDGVDHSGVEGAAQSPYRVPARRVDVHIAKSPVPTLWWRSVGHSHTALAVECFIDELAHAAGRDPLDLRRELLPPGSRELRALELAVTKSGYGASPLPAGRGHGLAVHTSFGSVVAMVAEASIERGMPRVHRVTAAVDCGTVVNPLTVEAQIQGAVIYALSALLTGEITLVKGRVQQENFHQYEIARIDQAPIVDVHIIAEGDPMGGIGEPGTPPAFGAILNALFAATGKRVRDLPLAKVRWS